MRMSWIPNLGRGQRTMCTRSSENSTQATGSMSRTSIIKEDTRRPGSVAERGPRSYVVVLNDGRRVWKRHADHVRRFSMDRAV